MTVKEVAKMYRTNEATIRYLASRGRIKINKVVESNSYVTKRYDELSFTHYSITRETCYREYIEPEEVERLDDMIYQYLLNPFDDSDQRLTVNERRRIRKFIKNYEQTHADILLILIEDMRR